MKKILYVLLTGVMVLAGCSKETTEEFASQDETTTFTLSMDELQTRAANANPPVRYIMEVWSEDGTTAENVFEDGRKNRFEITTGSSFIVTLDQTKAYTCLFWADDNTTYNAATLKSVSLNIGKEITEAYHAKVIVPKGKKSTVSVTLKRAVAKIILTENATIQTSKVLALSFSNIYPSFNVFTGEAIGIAAKWSKTVQPAATTGAIATLYFFAKATQELTEFKFTYAAEAERTLSNVPYQLNYATNIKGEYSKVTSVTFTINADDTYSTPDNGASHENPNS